MWTERRTELIALGVLLCACGSSAGAGGLETLTEFDAAQRERAWEGAPDLMAEAEWAIERAGRSEDTEAADEWRMTSRLLVEAAVAEATRVEEASALHAARAEIAELETQIARHERSRNELLAEARDARAAGVAIDSARRSLHYAAAYEARRPRRARGVDARERDEAIAILRERAEIFALASRTMGASAEELGPIEAALAPLEGQDPLRRALAAEELGLALLGEMRRRREVSDAMLESLAREAATRGLELAIEEGGARLGGDLRAGRVGALLDAFPHGNVVIFGAARERARLRGELGEARSRRLEERDGPALELLLPAYGPR